MDFPHVLLAVSGDVFHASGVAFNVQWSIRAEAETDTAARTSVRVDGRQVADITVHAETRDALVEETQSVSAALVWSAMRAVLGRIG